MRGDGVADDGMRRAAKQGDPEACYRLAGVMRSDGHGHEAHSWLKKAADAGHPAANYELASADLKSPYPASRSARRMRVAAAAGLPDALYELAAFLERDNKGKPPASPDQDPAPLMKRAGDLGQPDALLWLAQEEGHAMHAAATVALLRGCVAHGGSWAGEPAFDWLADPELDTLAEQADARNAEAMDRFARLIRTHHLIRYVYVPWFVAAGKAGHAGASCTVADILEVRDLGTADAVVWYQQAVEQGSTFAMVRLGDLATGDEALDWYRKAADAGDADASPASETTRAGAARTTRRWTCGCTPPSRGVPTACGRSPVRATGGATRPRATTGNAGPSPQEA
jgi:TPR repeat protein